MKMKIACIIPSSCSDSVLPLLSECVASIQEAAKGVVGVNMYISSTSKVNRKIKDKFKLVDFVSAGKNAGFSEMVNVGIDVGLKEHSPDYFLLINDDARIEKDFFKVFRKQAKKEVFDVVAPLVYKSSGEIDSFGMRYMASGLARNNTSLEFENNLANGSCMLVSADFLKKMKKKYGYYFNPIFNFYYEDMEFGIRTLGIKGEIIGNKDMVCYHHGSFTSVYRSYFTDFHSYRNIVWVIMISWPVKVVLKNIKEIVRFQFTSFIRSLKFPLLYLRIFIDTLLHLRKILRLREKTISGYHRDFDLEAILVK